MSTRTLISWPMVATLLLMPGSMLLRLGPAAMAQQQIQPPVRRVVEDPVREESPAVPGSNLATPVLGFMVRTSPPELRPILGVPGASAFGVPVQLPDGTTHLHLAPGQTYALAERERTSSLSLVYLDGQTLSGVTEISGALAEPALVVFSPTGRSAVLYSGESGQAQVLTGLPNSPRIARQLLVPPVEGGLQLLAINDDGDVLVVVDQAGHVFALAQDSFLSLVHAGAEIGGVAFVPFRSDLIACDPAQRAVYLIEDVGGTPLSSILASDLYLPPGPVVIQSSSDGRSTFFASVGSKRLSIIDRVSSKLETIDLPAPLDGLDALKVPTAMLLSARDNEPGWVLEASDSVARVLLVPALPGLRSTPAMRRPRSSQGGEW